MENPENELQENNALIDNAEINDYLLEISKWGKFLAIAGYVGIGIVILIAIFMMVGLSFISRLPGSGFPMRALGFLYILIAALYYFPVNYLYRFSMQVRLGIYMKNSNAMTSAFRNLKSVFKFLGIFTIVVLSIYVLILIIAVPAMLFLNH